MPTNWQESLRSLPVRLLKFFLQTESCRCSDDASGEHKKDCSCTSCHNLCASKEWSTENAVVEEPQGPTLQSMAAGDKVRIEKLCLPTALKKRLLSMGLTGGTEVAVINKEGGRMIIAVRDSRLGLSPEMAGRITCKRTVGGV